MSAENQDTSTPCCSSWGFAFAHLISRLWVAERLFMAGVDKFRKGSGWDHATFNMDNYHEKSAQIASLMSSNSFLPEQACTAFANGIGYVLLGVGAWVAIGLFTEFSLFLAGVVLLSLGFGLSALPDDLEVTSNIGIGILIVVAALATTRAKTFSLDALFFRRKSA
jgi:thiosulfate dehydrogenase [quinone] large subunit